MPKFLEDYIDPELNIEEKEERILFPHFLTMLEVVGRKYKDLGKKLHLIIVSGNSFDYLRGRLEILAENGLIAQSLKDGMLWKANPSTSYQEAIKKLDAYVVNNFENKFYVQGNMIRKTYKPTIDNWDKEFAEPIIKFAQEQCNFKLYDGNFSTGSGIMYYHHEDALDIDPREVTMVLKGDLPDEEIAFRGKAYAINKMHEWFDYKNSLAIGDTKNDLPMFESVKTKGGSCFAVANHKFSEEQIKEFNIKILKQPIIAGINNLLATWIYKMGWNK